MHNKSNIITYQVRIISVHHFDEDAILDAFQNKCSQIGISERLQLQYNTIIIITIIKIHFISWRNAQ